MALPPRIVSAHQDYVIASWENVVITRWIGKVERSAIQTAFELGQRQATQHDQGVVAISLIENGLSIPDAEVRQYASECVIAAEAYSLINATIIEGEGFWNSAARAALSGLMGVAGSKTPHRVFSTVAEAAPWIASSVDSKGVTAEGVLRAVQALR